MLELQSEEENIWRKHCIQIHETKIYQEVDRYGGIKSVAVLVIF